ncbi:hypothetical protein FA048_17940 [Pedobacter polaris]|uniref:Lipocalin-like domain-containing protein n=1 Tax=Pedobacter polaris TaxID=2571273 RepID=A0A4U1CGJ5_9SPHI|nr:hypothetical protein [Pedobacter polaris]TKC05601.1 hypothetical protein FA048_17940 [Pedobacter polaris]
MKFLSMILVICLYFSNTKAQEVNYQSIKGSWEYKSPKGKTKLTYKFDVDNKFTSLTEHKEKELQAEGMYEFDKKDDLDRLKLTLTDKANSNQSQILYHFIKFAGADTLKIQSVNDKQTKWLPERRRNTMIFVRKKEKPKE